MSNIDTQIETDFLSMPEVNPSQFSFWQDIFLNNIRILVERSGWANYLTYGIVEDALDRKIMMLKSGEEEEHPRYEEIKDDPRYEQLRIAIKRAIGDYRSFGWSYPAIIRTGKIKGEDKIIIKSFTSGDIDDGADVTFSIDKKGDITKATLLLRALSQTIDETQDSVAKLEDGLLLINEHGELYHGWSYLAPIFDSLFAEWALHDQLSTFVIRVSGGVHMMLMDESLWSRDPKALALRQNIKAQMDRMGKNTKLLAPKTINGVETEYKLYTGEGTQNWAEMQEVLLSPIAGYTGIPIESLKGQPTAFNSSENHTKKHLRQIESIEKMAIKILKWGTKQIWDIDDADFRIEEFQEMTEIGLIDIKTKKLAGLAQIVPHMDKLGLSVEKLFEYMDIDIEPDATLIAEAKARSEQMMNQLPGEPDGKESKEGGKEVQVPEDK